ncbi:MAG: hypothetical protein M3Y87_31145 [Myxococcota bacterium]|nr:hypothetical protein [Myxococcota bacterium]
MSDEEPRDREVVLPEPGGRWRTGLPIAGTIWVVLMLAIPLRYYAGDDRYDERFAWRMFSAVRVQSCRVGVTEESEAGARPVALMEVLPAPWAALLERNRPAVVEAFLRWRCEARDATERVRFHNECVDASGDALPSIDRVIDCGTGEITAREESPQ